MVVGMAAMATLTPCLHQRQNVPSKITNQRSRLQSKLASSYSFGGLSQKEEDEAHGGRAPSRSIYLSRGERERDMLVEGYHRSVALRSFLHRLISLLHHNGNSTNTPHPVRSLPLRLVDEVGNDSDFLWMSLSYLIRCNHPQTALQMFNCWRSKDKIRSSETNFSRIITLFCKRDFLGEAVSCFQDMQESGYLPPLKTYNAIIHGLARTKCFDDATAVMREMIDAGVAPKPETYNGLIQAFGSHKMYDDTTKCVKQMKSSGCSPDGVTYNILITVFAHGGLLERMERVYRTLISQHMSLQPSARVAMLEAYAEWEVLDKMEMAYQKVLKSQVIITESLVRKLARVHIKNRRYSCLEDLGHDMTTASNRSNLVWCLLLLASACSKSRRGVQSVIHEMEQAQVKFTTTFFNIIAYFCLRVKALAKLDAILIHAARGTGNLDIVTIGILFDACGEGFDGARVLKEWKKSGILQKRAEIETDELVLLAFGKGAFHRHCEKMYSTLEVSDKVRRPWKYTDLISLAFTEKNGNQNGCDAS